MPARPVPDRFKVAFSFAGEQRDLVRAIAQAVESRLGSGTVFYDDWFEHHLAGDDADLKLQSIYGERCDLAVVCVSQRYGGKPWTQMEHAAVRARLMQARAAADQRERDAILPIRVGEGEVPGILFNTIVPDVRGRTAEQSAELILDRLALLGSGPAAGAIGTAPAPAAPPADAGHPASQRKALTQALEQLAAQYEAAIQQSVNAIDAVAGVQAQRQAESIEQRMREIESKLAG
jgi:hypothetical protein